MKIAVLYAFHRNDYGWSTPISLINALERLGHQIKHFNLYRLDSADQSICYTDGGLIEFLDQQDNFDYLLHMDYGIFNSPLFKYVNIPCVLEAGDEPQRFRDNFNKANYFDLILSPDYISTQAYIKAGHNAKWFTHWADLTIHEPLNIKPDKFIVTTVDENRGNGLIKILRAELHDLFLDDRYFYAAEHTKFMAKGHAVLQYSQFGEITRRPFEAAACNKLVFTDRLAPERKFESIFQDGESIVFYDGVKDLIKKVKYYVQNLDEVQRIALNGQKIVLKEHTADIRAKQLIKYVGEII